MCSPREIHDASPNGGVLDDVLVLDNVGAGHALAAAVGTVNHDGLPCGGRGAHRIGFRDQS